MRSLIYKDFQSLEWYSWLLYYFVPIVVAVLIAFGIFSPLLLFLALLMPAEFSLGIWTADAKAKFDKYSDVLPVTRHKIVNKSFIMILTNSFYAFVVLQIGVIIGNISNGQSAFGFNNMLVLAIIFITLAMCGFGMLMMICFNYIVSVFIMSAFGGLFGGFSTSLASEGHIFDSNFISSNTYLTNMNLYFCVIAIGILILAVSWVVSLVVYKKKEL